MLRIHAVIIDTIRLTAALAGVIARQDRDLASQYRRALTSAAFNVAEGRGIGTLHRVVHPR